MMTYVLGLAFNGQKIFEMAADADHRVTFDGDVERDTRLVERHLAADQERRILAFSLTPTYTLSHFPVRSRECFSFMRFHRNLNY